MDFESINNEIETIKNQIESLRQKLQFYENQERFEKNDYFDSHCQNKLLQAHRMKEIYSLISTGLTSWEVAEKIKDNFSSVWDAYYFITHFLNEEKARKRYAQHFLVCALADYGLSNVKISKISGYTPQRCGQIIKSSHF